MLRSAISIAAVGLSLFVMSPAHAGKTEDTQAEVKKACNKDISADEALHLVKQLYLSCTEGTKVEVEAGCSVNCLKSSGGKVVGQ